MYIYIMESRLVKTQFYKTVVNSEFILCTEGIYHELYIYI